MATRAYAKARAQFGNYALDFVAFRSRPLERLSAAELGKLATMVRDADRFLAQIATGPSLTDLEVLELAERIRPLRAGAACVLAVAGPDASWGMTDEGARERLALTEEESAVLAETLLHPPEPNDALRAAWDDYKTFAGL